ncbi:MAG: ATP-binding protein [Desulfovibrionales bacterium]
MAMHTGKPVRMGVTRKLFLSSLFLIAVFGATTVYFYVRINGIVSDSSRIVSHNFMIADSTDRMAELLLSMLENKKRYEILGSAEYRENFELDLEGFQQTLNQVIPAGPPDPEGWDKFMRASARLANETEAGVSESMLSDLLERVVLLRQANEREIEASLWKISEAGERAVRIGFTGLSISLAAGLLGSVFLAWRLGGAFRELKRGIRTLHHKGKTSYVQISSRDELGELAAAFNEMSARLEQEERMRGDFISMLGTEIQTPLNGVRESVDRLLNEPSGTLTHRHHCFLKICDRELERLCLLLDQIMRVSNLSVGDYPMLPRETDAMSMIRESMDRVRQKAKEKQIDIQTSDLGDSAAVLADRNHIRQVLSVLLEHAIAASPIGSIVKTGFIPRPENQTVTFWVQDSASLLGDKEKEEIFHQYYRGPASGGDWSFGTMMSFSKRIVEVHGGSIWISGNSGTGNVISFTLPSIEEGDTKELS